MLYWLALGTHLLGLLLLAGGLVGVRVLMHWLWHQLDHRATGQALGLLPLLSQFSWLMQAGVALVLLSGLLEYHQMGQAAFDYIGEAGKLGLTVGLFLNQFLLIRPSIRQLTRHLLQLPTLTPNQASSATLPLALTQLRPRLKWAILIQLILAVLLLITAFNESSIIST